MPCRRVVVVEVVLRAFPALDTAPVRSRNLNTRRFDGGNSCLATESAADLCVGWGRWRLKQLASRRLLCRGLVKWKWIQFFYLCNFLPRFMARSQYYAAAICHRTERPG